MKASEFKDTYKFDFKDYPDAVWFNIRKTPFKIYGLYKPLENEHFVRLPYEVAANTNEGVKDLYLNTSGGRFSFATDSPYIAIHALQPTLYVMPHMPRTGSAGFDAYVCDENKDQVYVGTFFANVRSSQEYFASINSRTNFGKVFNYVIDFPLYEKVDDVYIGVHKDAEIDVYDTPYTDDLPIVFYGSSITQGGCVSRPGLMYPNILSRRFHRDIINLGFSGSCRGEQTILDYMANLKMSVFVCDYDHNAPTSDHLRKTHYNVYETIRKKNPDLPFIMVSKPDVLWFPDSLERKNIILDSYNKALSLGDKNVYFVDGFKMFEGDYYDSCTVDNTHPNDLGHYLMAKHIGEAIEEIIEKE